MHSSPVAPIEARVQPTAWLWLRTFRAADYASRAHQFHRAHGWFLLLLGWALGNTSDSPWVFVVLGLGISEAFNFSPVRAAYVLCRLAFDQRLRRILTYTANDSHFTVQGAFPPVSMSWSAVRAAVETDSTFAILASLSFPLPIPKAGLSAAQALAWRRLLSGATRLVDHRTPSSPLESALLGGGNSEASPSETPPPGPRGA